MVSLGIDIGTTSICVVCYDLEKDRIVKCLYGTNDFLETGSFEQEPEKIVDTVYGLLGEMLDWMSENSQPGSRDLEPLGIGVSSQMHGILYINKEGRAVSPFYTWKNEYGSEIYKDGQSYGDYLSRQTGCECYPGWGSATHLYLKEKHKIPENAVSFLNIGDYLVLRLTGKKQAVTSPTLAASLGGFCLKTGEFELEKLAAAGADISYYPVPAKESRAGELILPEGNGKAGEALDCEVKERKDRPGISVFYAIGDNQASFLGAVKDRENTISINVGTGSQVSVYSRELYQTKGVEARPFAEQGYLYVGASLNGGKVYERLGRFFEEICEWGTGQKADGYQIMEKMGAETEKTDLIVVPALYGARHKKGKEAGIYNLTQENFHGGDLVRSFAVGMAKELYDLYQRFPEKLRAEKTQIAASGNGIRKNKLLKEEIEKIFKLPVFFTDREEEAAAGAALNAGEGIKKRGASCRL